MGKSIKIWIIVSIVAYLSALHVFCLYCFMQCRSIDMKQHAINKVEIASIMRWHIKFEHECIKVLEQSGEPLVKISGEGRTEYDLMTEWKYVSWSSLVYLYKNGLIDILINGIERAPISHAERIDAPKDRNYREMQKFYNTALPIISYFNKYLESEEFIREEDLKEYTQPVDYVPMPEDWIPVVEIYGIPLLNVLYK